MATYVKGADGKWHHMASNISATSMADDVLQLLRARDGTTYLSRAAADKLSVESIQLEYPTPLRLYSPSSQLQSLQTLDAILKPDPTLTRFYGT